MKKGLILLVATTIVMLLAASLFLNYGNDKAVQGQIGTTESTKFTVQSLESLSAKSKLSTKGSKLQANIGTDPQVQGICGSLHNQTIYDFDNNGDAIDNASPGLCEVGSVENFAYNPNAHTRNWICKGIKESVDCTASETWCGDYIVNGNEQCDGFSSSWVCTNNCEYDLNDSFKTQVEQVVCQAGYVTNVEVFIEGQTPNIPTNNLQAEIHGTLLDGNISLDTVEMIGDIDYQNGIMSYAGTLDFSIPDTNPGQFTVHILIEVGENEFELFVPLIVDCPVNAGTLSCVTDTTDENVDHPKLVLAGTRSDYLGSREITAEGESIHIKDIEFTADGLEFSNSFEELKLLADDGVTELYSEYIFSNTIQLHNIGGVGGNNYILQPGTENVYVQLDAKETSEVNGITEGGEFTLSMDVTEAIGIESNQAIVASNSPLDCVGESHEFISRAARIDYTDLVSSASSISLPNTLAQGLTNNIAIIKIQSDQWTNENPYNGSDIDIELQTIQAEIENYTDNILQDVRIRRLGESQFTTAQNVPVGSHNILFDMTELSAEEDNKISSSETVYFVIEGIPTDANDQADSIQVNMVGLDNGAIIYKADFAGSASTNVLYLGIDEIDGYTIFGPNNY